MTTSEIVRAAIAIILIAIVVARRMGLKKKLEERKAKAAKEKRIQRHKEQKREQREQHKQRQEARLRETTEIRLQTLVGTVHGVANVGGQKLHYAVGGDREKAAAVLVLLHGFAGDKEIWQALALHLLKWPIHLVIPDLPGFGQNDPVLEATYDASSQAKRIKALVHGLGIEKYHLVGHSVGANIAATLAYGDRQCVSSLTLAEPFGYRVPHQSALDQMLANQRNPFMISTPEAYENLLGFLHAQPVSVDPRLKKLRAEEMAKRRQLKLRIWQHICECERAHLIEMLLPELNLPTLVLQGAASQVVHPSTAEAMASHLSRGRAVVLPECGHMLMADKPAEVAQAILAHLQEAIEVSSAAG